MKERSFTNEERLRLRELCGRAVRGRHLTLDDMRFCEKMLKVNPTEYHEISVAERKVAVAEINPLAHA